MPQFSGDRSVAPRLTAPGFAGNRASSALARTAAAGGRQYRPPYTGDHRRDNYPRGRGAWPVWPYNYGFVAYPSFLDYPWDYDESDSQENVSQGPLYQDYDSQSADQQPPEYPEPPAWPSLNGQQNAPQSNATSQPAEPVTLVFNDGRAPEKIYNYVLTPATLYVMDEHRREIAVDQLDLAATAKVNREAGIDFKLPVESR
jgi:hypothetical protein